VQGPECRQRGVQPAQDINIDARLIRTSDAANQSQEGRKELRMVCMTLLAVSGGLGQGQGVVGQLATATATAARVPI
jgi:hypothetical protein